MVFYTCLGLSVQAQDYFRDKGRVVTGAASGIGFAVSDALLRVGAVVFMADRDEKMPAAPVEQLDAHVGRAHSALVDVTDQEQVKQVIQDAAFRHGRLDVLFNPGVFGRLQGHIHLMVFKHR
jgi:NADP-dependent 3-hydroxy acid dehydrogenase YdfG